MRNIIAVTSLLVATSAFAGNGSGWPGVAADRIEERTELKIDLSSSELLEALNNGLAGKPIIIKRPNEVLNLKAVSFDFAKRAIHFETEFGQRMLGREMIEP